jgi:hypothetical protein
MTAALRPSPGQPNRGRHLSLVPPAEPRRRRARHERPSRRRRHGVPVRARVIPLPTSAAPIAPIAPTVASASAAATGAGATRGAPPRPPPAAARRRRLEATYRRRRVAVGLLVAGVVGVAGLVADSVLTGPGGVPASAAGAGTASVEHTVTAHAGDSMWSIAEVFHGATPMGEYVEALIARNGGTHLEVGQLVRLP